MNKWILCFLLIVGYTTTYAQPEVKITKKVIISDREGKKLIANISGGDTTYLYLFRNVKYETLIDYKAVSLSRSQLKDFADALEMLTSDEYKAGEASIKLERVELTKYRSFGITSVWVWADHGFAMYRLPQCHKVKKEIYGFLDIKP